MKTRFFILLGLIAIAITSCDINGSTNNTPVIKFVTAPFINKTDTLNVYLTDESDVIRLDTIHVGDTVTFRMLFYGYSNNLSTCNIIQSDTSATKMILPSTNSLDSVFLSSSSDYSAGKFIIKNKISSLYFPFRYVAKKVSNDVKLSFYITSDANLSGLGSNSASFVLKTPIKSKKLASAAE